MENELFSIRFRLLPSVCVYVRKSRIKIEKNRKENFLSISIARKTLSLNNFAISDD